MHGNFFIRLVVMIFIVNQSRTTHGIFRVPFELPISTPFGNHRQFYVQPQQQLIIYPQLNRAPLPQSFYQQPQSLFVPQTIYSSTSRFISPQQVGAGYYDPIVSYIQHQPSYQTSSYMNFNLGKRLSNVKPVEGSEMNIPDVEKSVDSVVIKSEDKPDCNDNHDEEFKKEMPDKMETTTNNVIETTTTIIEVIKSEMENQKNQEYSTTDRVIEANTEEKMQ